MTPEDEKFVRDLAQKNNECLAALDPETREFLKMASIWPCGTNASGEWVFERNPVAQGDHGSYTFTVAPSSLQSGYTAVTIADALFNAGWCQGADRVRSELRRGLGLR